MTRYTMHGKTKLESRYSNSSQQMLEEKLDGLSSIELMQLRELAATRLSNRQKITPGAGHTAEKSVSHQRLTARQAEVLILVVSGYTRSEVAEALKISRNTAATHIANIYRKLEIGSIAEATTVALRMGIVS